MFPVTYLKREHLLAGAERLKVPVAVITAIARIEGGRGGFIAGTDLPVILFEGHQFRRRTAEKYDRSHPDISHPYAQSRSHYKGGRGEYDRLLKAIRADGNKVGPALSSASWGKFQIMGFNHALAGHDTVEGFVNDMALGEDRQLAAFLAYIEARGLADALRGEKWAEFAAAYNGADYRSNKYDVKLATAVRKATLEHDNAGEAGWSLERGDVVELQAALNWHLQMTLAIDGWMGPNTRNAILQLQEREASLTPTGKPDRATLEFLGIDCDAYLAHATEA
ncbi:N-acetylmuramidase domain-containing protein [Mangrovicoccus algicola]|uniref:DUF3380 domain-containing protein n=1 Tax=Mangrovicoccus algicola TaxID=2771008 RepID=A0A8J6Z5I3_9RHOB|nr:N-acetylmuramidase domain-containing protein [Mangrovicoccus algicola]MBE3636680.1 DUF3380 domain-containing protein [Mangrovicoccus algicola]